MTPQSDCISNLAKALAAAQGEIANPGKNREAKVKGLSKTGKEFEYTYKYADFGEALDGIRKALAKHGLAITQAPYLDNSTLLLSSRILHESGEWIGCDYPVCTIQGDHQKMGAAITYARRYALFSLVGVVGEDDTDGQGAAGVENGSSVKRNGKAPSPPPAPGAQSPLQTITSTIDTFSDLAALNNWALGAAAAVAKLPFEQQDHAKKALAHKRGLLAQAPKLAVLPAEMEPNPKLRQRLADSAFGDGYDKLIADWTARLTLASRDEQEAIFEAEIEPRREANGVFAPDYNKLLGLIKNA